MGSHMVEHWIDNESTGTLERVLRHRYYPSPSSDQKLAVFTCPVSVQSFRQAIPNADALGEFIPQNTAESFVQTLLRNPIPVWNHHHGALPTAPLQIGGVAEIRLKYVKDSTRDFNHGLTYSSIEIHAFVNPKAFPPGGITSWSWLQNSPPGDAWSPIVEMSITPDGHLPRFSNCIAMLLDDSMLVASSVPADAGARESAEKVPAAQNRSSEPAEGGTQTNMTGTTMPVENNTVGAVQSSLPALYEQRIAQLEAQLKAAQAQQPVASSVPMQVVDELKLKLAQAEQHAIAVESAIVKKKDEEWQQRMAEVERQKRAAENHVAVATHFPAVMSAIKCARGEANVAPTNGMLTVPEALQLAAHLQMVASALERGEAVDQTKLVAIQSALEGARKQQESVEQMKQQIAALPKDGSGAPVQSSVEPVHKQPRVTGQPAVYNPWNDI